MKEDKFQEVYISNNPILFDLSMCDDDINFREAPIKEFARKARIVELCIEEGVVTLKEGNYEMTLHKENPNGFLEVIELKEIK